MPRDRGYWIAEWLTDNALSSADDVERALNSPTVVAELRRVAGKADRRSRNIMHQDSPADGFSILAGRGIDLSGQLVCRSEVCRRRQVDELFSRVWHYFDKIIVHDNIALDVERFWDDPKQNVKEAFLGNIRVLEYLRAIGAEDLVEFRPKPHACTVHFDKHAEEAGLVELTKGVDEIVESLKTGAKISIKSNEKGEREFKLRHPLLEVGHRGTLDKDCPHTPEAERQQALTLVVQRLIAHLCSDIAASHLYHAPLGATLKTHEIFLQQFHPVSVTDVVLNLDLPVLDGLKTWDLIEIRRDEREYFARFRDALTKTISERLKADPYGDAPKIAEEITHDLIEPRLRDITTRLKAAQKLVTKKSTVGLFLGAVSTTCGILSGMDPHLATMGGTGVTLACTGTATAKYLDEARDISLDDMYFLWKAAECAPHPT